MPKKKYTPGFIYIATNKEMPYVIKIGFTIDVDSRMGGLSRATGVPDDFKAVWLKEAPCIEIAEDAIHYILREYRKSKSKEFFQITIREAIRVSEHVIKSLFETKIVKPKYSEKDWETIIKEDRPKFVKKAIRLCLKEGRYGEPVRKRFGTLRCNYKGTDIITIYILKDCFKVGIHCNKQSGKQIIQGIFGKRKIRIEGWRDGYSVFIEDSVSAEKVFEWLKLGKHRKQKQILAK
ncbi:MAG: GIY-YIG nuclease family protein [Bacteroidia bacterium]